MTFPTPDFSAETMAAAKAHAVASFPRESCGLIVAGNYVPCENTAADPEKDFRIAPEHLIDAGANLQAVIHSHPDSNREPSEADTQGQIDTGCIWGIIPCNAQEAYEPLFWGDFRLETPLIGRKFIYGADDCATLIRAWYWQNRGIKLRDFARPGGEWWKENEDIYLQRFIEAGFRPITMGEAKEGDVVLGRTHQATAPNHGGIVLDNDLVLHCYREGRPSRREPIGRWLSFIKHWLRYEGN